jgi:hypothetical protein
MNKESPYTSVSMNTQMKRVLSETVRILFPLTAEPDALVKPHVWRDRRYVGEFGGKVAAWRGWSANLVRVDFRYRAVFVDLVENTLPLEDQLRLFGEPYVAATATMTRYVIMFVLDFPLDAVETISKQSFVARYLTTTAHACVIATVDEFMDISPLQWAARVARLVMLQRLLSIHRKPIDSNEVPFQNLLYRTGYLHSYLVSGGLELRALSKPRRSGDFGHDFHAVVRNPVLAPSELFSVGIEVYMGALGYHATTIPKYIGQYNLRGLIVVAKDDPLPQLFQVTEALGILVFPARQLTSMGTTSAVGIHHLPIDRVVLDMISMRDQLETLIPTVSSLNQRGLDSHLR